MAKTSGGRSVGPRAVAATVIRGVVEGGSLSDILAHRLESVPPQERPLVQEFGFGVTRWYFRLDAIRHSLLQRPLKEKDGDIAALILVGLYQLLYMRIPPHAVVSETVEGVRQLGKSWAAGLLNGLLRRFQRERTEQLAKIDQDPSVRLAHPPWLLGELRQAWPDCWESVAEAANRRPPLSLRVNRLRGSRKEYAAKLASVGITCSPIPGTEEGLVLDQPMDVRDLPGFAEGLVSVQDGGAQLAAPLLELQSGLRVLDACSAPGGKSCHILELKPGLDSLTALDISPDRLERVGQNLQRLGLKAELHVGNAAEPAGEWARGSYHRILLDVPCSATGVIRRHPDIKLLRREKDIAALSELQSRMLADIWPLLAPEGILLYATCSLLPRENEEVVQRFVAGQPDACERPIEASWGHARACGRQTLPGEATMDGFYYARLEKRP